MNEQERRAYRERVKPLIQSGAAQFVAVYRHSRGKIMVYTDPHQGGYINYNNLNDGTEGEYWPTMTVEE